MNYQAVTVRVEAEKAKLLDFLADEYNRSRNYLINDAIDRYLEEEAQHVHELLAAMEEADAGKGVPHAQAMQEFSVLIDSIETKKP